MNRYGLLRRAESVLNSRPLTVYNLTEQVRSSRSPRTILSRANQRWCYSHWEISPDQICYTRGDGAEYSIDKSLLAKVAKGIQQLEIPG